MNEPAIAFRPRIVAAAESSIVPPAGESALQATEQAYRRVLSVQPHHFRTLCGLAMVRAQLGDADDAQSLLAQADGIADPSAESHLVLGKCFAGTGDVTKAAHHYQRAVDLDDGQVEARLLLGHALCMLGDVADAVTQFDQALAHDPHSIEAHQSLGLALQRLGQFDRAIAHHESALSIKPDHLAARAGLGDACRQLRRHEEAVAHYQQALAINPQASAVLVNLGGCYHAMGRREDAVRTFQQALTHNSRLADVHYNLGNIYLELDSWQAAVFHYERAIAERPNFPEAHNNLGNALQKRGRCQDAITSYQEAILLQPRYATALRNLGDAWRAVKRYDEAISSYRAALAVAPDDTVTMNHLGGVLMIAGRIDEATRTYEAALAIAPHNVGIQLNCANVKPFKEGDPRLPHLQDLASRDEQLADEARIALHFALGKAYSDLRDGERSLTHLSIANRLERRHVTYDELATLSQMERVGDAFTADVMRNRSNAGAPSDAPVFIIGMPRSGTSLIEQILASHPNVFGAGEIDFFAASTQIFTERARRDYPDLLEKLSSDDLRDLGKSYLARLGERGASAERIVDKMPSNFLFAGLIHLALPNARIIHVRRNPIDTCLSCFSLLFAEGQPFAYDLGELGRYYNAYDALMTHWRKVLPATTMIEVQYEDVVGDVEVSARRILAHCGLDWDERCLAFHHNKRPVDTASLVQVRRPLFTDSIGRWRLYGARLQPLLDALGDNAGGTAMAAVTPPSEQPELSSSTAIVTPPNHSAPVSPETEQGVLTAEAERTLVLAKKLQARGDDGDAEQLFRFILAAQPGHFGALTGLGMICSKTNRLDESKRHFTQAIAINDKSPEAHGSLGALHASSGDLETAVACYHKALSLAPEHPGILYAYAMVLQSQGKNDEAMATLRRAIANKPEHLDAHFALGNLLYAAGKDIEAAKSYLKVLEYNPRHAETHNNIANVLLRQGHPGRGVEHYRQAIASRPDYADAYGNLGNAFLELNRMEEAIEQNLLALKLKPDRFGSYNNLGVAYQALGRFDEATKAFERAIELRPDEAPIYLNLANMKKFTPEDRRLPGLRGLLDRVGQLDGEKQAAAHFAMGKALADLKDHDQAFRHLQKGNALKRNSFDYDEAQRLATLEHIATRFTPEFFGRMSGHGDTSFAPIFIVGMPRSGTTLLEQVLASHSRVFGAGELEAFKDLIGECAKRQHLVPAYPDLIGQLSPEQITELGKGYTNRVRALAPDAERIVDKMPLNFMFVGLIHLALPNAKIINITRDPLDTCVSCYSLLFTGAQPFAYDLGELGRYYRGYERAMAHWHKVLPPGVMIDVKYEELVDDLEGVSRGVLAHCGLDWEDGCREFQSTERSVRTASLMQVREPLYRTAIGSWRRYEKFLGPLREALGLDPQAGGL